MPTTTAISRTSPAARRLPALGYDANHGPDLRPPYSEQFSFGIQRELPLNLFIEVDYVGSLARHLMVEPDINQPTWAKLASVPSTTNENSIRPYPGFGTIQEFMSEGTANYYALQVKITRRAGSVLFTRRIYVVQEPHGCVVGHRSKLRLLQYSRDVRSGLFDQFGWVHGRPPGVRRNVHLVSSETARPEGVSFARPSAAGN